MRFATVAVAAFVGLAAASQEMTLKQRQVAVITGVLTNIESITQDLDKAISAWNGGDSSPVINGSKKLIQATTEGTATVNAATAVTKNEALQIQAVVQSVQTEVETTINHLISKKAAIKSANLGGETYNQLTQQLEGAKNIAAAITAKVPTELGPVAQKLSEGILKAVQKGVDAYAEFQGQPGISGTGPAVAGAGAAAGAAGAAGARVSNVPTTTATAAAGAAAAGTTPAAASADMIKPAFAVIAAVAFGAAVVAL